MEVKEKHIAHHNVKKSKKHEMWFQSFIMHSKISLKLPEHHIFCAWLETTD